MLLRDKLVSDFVEIILDSVKNNGWLTEISDAVGINRNKFTPDKMSRMKLFCVLRILTGLAWQMSQEQFSTLWMALGKLIFEMGEQHYFEFCDEMRNMRKKTKNDVHL